MINSVYVQFQNAVAELRSERGAAMAEYGLLLALVAVASIAILITFGGAITEVFTEADTALRGASEIPAEG